MSIFKAITLPFKLMAAIVVWTWAFNALTNHPIMHAIVRWGGAFAIIAFIFYLVFYFLAALKFDRMKL